MTPINDGEATQMYQYLLGKVSTDVGASLCQIYRYQYLLGKVSTMDLLWNSYEDLVIVSISIR